MQDDYEIIDQWKRTGLLNGLSENVMDHCAYLLENQRLYNLDDNLTPQFRRISIPILRRVYGNLLEKKIKVECFLTEAFSNFLETNIGAEIKLPDPMLGGDSILETERVGCEKIAEQLSDLVYGLVKAKKSKLVYLEGLGMENGKLVVFYEL